MKKKILFLFIVLVGTLSINVDAKEVTLNQTKDEIININDVLVNNDAWHDSINIDVFSKKGKDYQVVELEYNEHCTVKDFIKNIISDDELINGNSVRLFITMIDYSYVFIILTYEDDIEMYYDRNVNIGQIIPKGTLMAGNIILNSEFKDIFYTDQDYYIKSNYGWDYSQYYEIEPSDSGFNLNCLNTNNNNHNCELYYNYGNILSSMYNNCNSNCKGIFEENIDYIEMKYKVKLNNLEGTIKIENEELPLEEDKEYTVRINKESMTDKKRLLAGIFKTTTIDPNSISNINIIPISNIAYTTDGEYELPVEIKDLKCEYKLKEKEEDKEKELSNPLTTFNKKGIIIMISIIIILSTLAIFVKKEYITKI